MKFGWGAIAVPLLYLSIWLDSKPVVWDFSCIVFDLWDLQSWRIYCCTHAKTAAPGAVVGSHWYISRKWKRHLTQCKLSLFFNKKITNDLFWATSVYRLITKSNTSLVKIAMISFHAIHISFFFMQYTFLSTFCFHAIHIFCNFFHSIFGS